MNFSVGDTVRVLSNSPWDLSWNEEERPAEIYGRILYISPNPLDPSRYLVHHEIDHPAMHGARGLDPFCRSWWYGAEELERISSLSINPEIDLDSIL